MRVLTHDDFHNAYPNDDPDIPSPLMRLFQLANEAIGTHGNLDEMESTDPDHETRLCRAWDKAQRRIDRRMAAFESALRVHNERARQDEILVFASPLDSEPTITGRKRISIQVGGNTYQLTAVSGGLTVLLTNDRDSRIMVVPDSSNKIGLIPS